MWIDILIGEVKTEYSFPLSFHLWTVKGEGASSEWPGTKCTSQNKKVTNRSNQPNNRRYYYKSFFTYENVFLGILLFIYLFS